MTQRYLLISAIMAKFRLTNVSDVSIRAAAGENCWEKILLW